MFQKKVFSLVLFAMIVTILCATTGLTYAASLNLNSPLTWPLDGSGYITQYHGDNWSGTPTYCPSFPYRHVGIDIYSGGQDWIPVVAARDGQVKAVYSAGAGYGQAMTIQHYGYESYNLTVFTTNYTHIVPNVSSGVWVTEGQLIGWTAPNLAVGSHLHFGIRRGLYSNTSNRGALPIYYCQSNLPAYEENFVDPLSVSYH